MLSTDRARLLVALALVLALASGVRAQVPDVTGTFQGVLDYSVHTCVPPSPPASFSAIGPLVISNQSGSVFHIAGTLDVDVAAPLCEIVVTGSGTTSTSGNLSGNITYTYSCNNGYGSAGSATFIGFVSGTLVNLQFDGVDTDVEGYTCQTNGLFAGLCSASCPNTVLGACCFDADTCLQINDALCASQGGDFEGGGTTCATTDCPVVCPGVPLGLVATDGTQATWVLLSWLAAADADEYQVWRVINGQAGAQPIGFSTNGALWYTDSTAVPGVTYRYWVRARNDGCWSAFGPPDTGFIAAAAPPPAPTGFIATDGTQEAYVLMSWVAAPTATQYQVWRAEQGGALAALGTSTNGAVWYADSTAVPGVVYDYAVRAGNGGVWGPPSATDSGFRPAPCPADLDSNGQVEFFDLALVLQGWGPCVGLGECAADIDSNGEVGFADLGLLLTAWGACD